MALIKKCPCGWINDSNKALCRKCGNDILFETPVNMPDDEYKRIMGQDNGGEYAPNPSSPPGPDLFKFCKWCGETNFPDSAYCSKCGGSLAGVHPTTPDEHNKPKQQEPGKYLESLDGMCLVQPKKFGEKSILGRSSADKAVKEYLESRMGVSRNHANIWHDGSKLYIEDVGSTNGTYIDISRIEPNIPYELKSGSQVTLGSPCSSYDKIAIFKVR
jgi:hypothetical protein